ncbi:glycosyltransferase [Stetteria hydrogenophila]
MRVGFVSRYPPVHCGVGEYTRMLAGSLRSVAPHLRVVVYSTYEAGREPYEDRAHGVTVRPSYERLSGDFTGVLDALAEDGGVEVLHVQHEYGIQGASESLVEALLEAKRERLARLVAITMHTVYHPLSGMDEALRFQRLIGELDLVVVHSHLQEYELQVQGVPPWKIHRVPHGTLINEYLGYPRGVLLKSLAEEVGLDPGRLRGMTLAIPGFLRPDKGLDVLAEALKKLEPGWATVVVAGEVRSGETVKALEGLESLVLIERYLSHDQILKLAALADAVLLPYRDKPGAYAVSGILHLSMGSLKPIIGTRVPRLFELYQLAPGLTVPPRDPDSLAWILRWLRENYDQASSFMSSVYAYAAKTQWPRVARRHLSIYRALLEGWRHGSLAHTGFYDW